MEEITEEQLERQFENILGNLNFDGWDGTVPFAVTVIGVGLIALFCFFRWYAKRQKDKEANDLISKYYEEYMNSEIDMDFQDYVFCRENDIAVRKKKTKDSGRIKSIKRTNANPLPKEAKKEEPEDEEDAEAE